MPAYNPYTTIKAPALNNGGNPYTNISALVKKAAEAPAVAAPAQNNGGNPYTNIIAPAAVAPAASPVVSPFGGAVANAGSSSTAVHPLTALTDSLHAAVSWMQSVGASPTGVDISAMGNNKAWNALPSTAPSNKWSAGNPITEKTPGSQTAVNNMLGLLKQNKTNSTSLSELARNNILSTLGQNPALSNGGNPYTNISAGNSMVTLPANNGGNPYTNVAPAQVNPNDAAKTAAQALLNGTGTKTTPTGTNNSGLDPVGQAELAAWYKKHPGWARDYINGGYTQSQILDLARTQSLDPNSKYYDPSQAYKAGFAYDDVNGPMFARGKQAIAGYYYNPQDGRYYPINLPKAWDQLGLGHWRNPYLDDKRWYNYGANASSKTYNSYGGGGGGSSYSNGYSNSYPASTSASSWYNSLMSWKI